MNNFITYLLNLKDTHKLNSEIIPSPPSELVIRMIVNILLYFSHDNHYRHCRVITLSLN